MSLSLCAVSAEILACHLESCHLRRTQRPVCAVMQALHALEAWMALQDGYFYDHSLACLHEQGAPCIRGLLKYLEHFRLMHKGEILRMQVDQRAFQVHTAQSCGGRQRRPLLDPLLL